MKKAIAALASLASLTASAAPAPAATNAQIVRAFYEDVFIRHQTAEAAERYLAPDYIQHNPYVATGRAPFVEYFVPYFQSHPDAVSEIVRVIADGDMVALHVHAHEKAGDRGTAIVDLFRVENGKIVEHWDVIQAVPETAANPNTMF